MAEQIIEIDENGVPRCSRCGQNHGIERNCGFKDRIAELEKQLAKTKHTKQIYFDRWTKGCEREAVLREDKERLDKILEQIQLLQTAVQTGSDYVMAMERLFSMKHICKEARAALEGK